MRRPVVPAPKRDKYSAIWSSLALRSKQNALLRLLGADAQPSLEIKAVASNS